MERKTTPADFARYLSRFLGSHLPHDRNVSPNTIATYRDTFVSFLNYMRDVQHMSADRVSLTDLNRDNVVNYLHWLVDEQKNSIATRNNRLAAIRAFVSYLQYESIEQLDEWQRILAVKGMKKPHSMPKHFSSEGIKCLLEQPDRNDLGEMRHLAILSLMYDTGCRVQELADITVGSLQIQTPPCSVVLFGKGRKVRTVPLSDGVVEILKAYIGRYHIEGLGTRNNNPLFYNHAKSKLSRAGVTYILKKYADMARIHCPLGVPDVVSCHQLRHSRAMHLLEAGTNLIWIRDVLGHATIQTTEIYARTNSQQRREAIAKASEDLTPSAIKGDWVDKKDMISWLKSFGR